jgi:hypothetical protein
LVRDSAERRIDQLSAVVGVAVMLLVRDRNDGNRGGTADHVGGEPAGHQIEGIGPAERPTALGLGQAAGDGTVHAAPDAGSVARLCPCVA